MKSFHEYKKATSATIAALQTKATELEFRAEKAEQRERSLAAELNIWKHRATTAEAELKSRGVQ